MTSTYILTIYTIHEAPKKLNMQFIKQKTYMLRYTWEPARMTITASTNYREKNYRKIRGGLKQNQFHT